MAMIAFNYENQGNNTYLVYEIKDTDTVDTMSLGMLTNNRIPGIAQTLYTQMDRTRLVRFNVSAKVNVTQFFSGTVNKKRLMGVFNGIADAMLAAEDYMIDENTILLNKDYIFADVSTCDTVMICLPIANAQAGNHDLGAFFKDVIFTTQFDQTENCDYIAKIINYLNSAPRFSIVDFKSVLDEITKSAAAEPVQTPPAQQPPVQTPPAYTAPAQQPPVQTPPPYTAPPQQPPVQTPPAYTTPAQQPPVQQPPVQTPPVQQPPKQTPPPTPGMPPIPPVNGGQPMPQAAPQAAPEEKGMSWLYLMQHYNKENAAAYKAQKEARKRGAAVPPQQMPPQQMPPQQMPPQQPPRQTPPAPAGNDFGFAVPGAMPPQPPKAGKHQAAPVPQQVNPTPVQNIPAQPPVQQVPQNAYVPIQASQGQMANFGETTVLGGGSIGETTVLGASPVPSAASPKPMLVRLKNNERIPLNKPVFRVGKERSYVDYFVGDNPAISRSHANFIIRDGEYFVVDTNSTNHTYVNEKMINSSVETKLNDGDKVRLANEEFEFKVQL